jgi:hypothetical protein
MSQPLTCPSCGTALRVRPEAAEGPVTCPRCLAAIPRATAITTAPAAGPAATCAECGQPLEEGWRVCPNCGEPCPGRAPVRPGRRFTADVDVRRDTARIGVGMILLAVLGGLGIFWLLAGAMASGDAASSVGAVVVGVLFVGLIAAGIGWLRTRSNPAAFGVGRVIVGTLALSGGLLLTAVLIGIAGFVFLFVACFMGGGRF